MFLAWILTAALAAAQGAPMNFEDVAYRYPTRMVEVAGVSMAYIDSGQGSAVVFLHGNGSDLSVFDGIYPALSDRHRVIGVDLPGFGKSAKPRLDYGAEWYAGRVEGLLQALRIERCAVVGHSFGGLVALSLALEHPERVSSLVLVDSPGAYSYPEFQVAFMRDAFTPERILSSTPDQIRGAMTFALGQWRDEYEAWVEKRVGLSRSKDYPDYAHASHRALIATLETRLEARLSEIKVPVLVIWGGRDLVVPRQAGVNLREALPDARLELIEEAAHFPMLTHRERFLELLGAFLEETER